MSCSAALLLVLLAAVMPGAAAEGEAEAPSTLPAELAHANFTGFLQELPESRWVGARLLAAHRSIQGTASAALGARGVFCITAWQSAAASS